MPAWNYDMEQTFGQKAPLFRTTEDVNSAMYTLYWWRVEYGLENPVMFRRRQLYMIYFDPEEYGMCTDDTRTLGDILVNYMYRNYGDDRPMNFYPLLDNLTTWMDKMFA